MEKMTIEEIAAALGSKAPVSGDVTNICTDTRKLEKGCLFIALKGANFDGHSFVKIAVEKGAVAIITEMQVANCPCIVVGDTRKALLDLAKYYRKKFPCIVAGVTGSVGKTSTKEMVYLALSAKYKTLKNEGNLNNEIGVPITLFNLDSSYGAAVIEMGMSHFGEIHRLSSITKPDVAVITNIGYSHIENLGTQDGIAKAKFEILDGMEYDAPLILNGDDKILVTQCPDRNAVFYGIENNDCDIRAIDIKAEDTTEFNILYNGNKYPVKLNCIGIHNVYNALAAFAVGVNCNIEPLAITEKLCQYKTIGMRQNIQKMGEQTIIVDCYNASPDSMKAALSVLSQIEPLNNGRRVAVLADMLELGDMSKELHRKVGEMVADSKVDKLICYGEMSKYIAIRADELGLHSGSTTDKDMLIHYLKMTLKPEDVVLFKGSRGMKLEEIIKEFYK